MPLPSGMEVISVTVSDGTQKRQKKDARPDGRGWTSTSCWFCLASPNVEKHLVVTIATEVYIALPKGEENTTHTHRHTQTRKTHTHIVRLTHNHVLSLSICSP